MDWKHHSRVQMNVQLGRIICYTDGYVSSMYAGNYLLFKLFVTYSRECCDFTEMLFPAFWYRIKMIILVNLVNYIYPTKYQMEWVHGKAICFLYVSLLPSSGITPKGWEWWHDIKGWSKKQDLAEITSGKELKYFSTNLLCDWWAPTNSHSQDCTKAVWMVLIS